MSINVGQRVRHPRSGLDGQVVARTEWLHGCVRLTVQPEGHKDRKPFDTFSDDEPEFELIVAAAPPRAKGSGGPMDDPRQRPEPRR